MWEESQGTESSSRVGSRGGAGLAHFDQQVTTPSCCTHPAFPASAVTARFIAEEAEAPRVGECARGPTVYKRW